MAFIKVPRQSYVGRTLPTYLVFVDANGNALVDAEGNLVVFQYSLRALLDD